MKLDLRDRCQRARCSRLIRKGKIAQQNYASYKPFCSFACREWDRLEVAQEYINRRLAAGERNG